MTHESREAQVASVARIRTDRAARYGKQLASHLGRKVHAEWDDAAGQGVVSFNDPATTATLVGEAEALVIRLVAAPQDVERLEDVLGRHLVRFGARDELVCSWTRDDGTTGTVQRGEG